MYDSSLKYKWDNKNVIDYAREEGKQEGIELGIEKGIAKGIEKGEYKKAVAVALEFKKMGLKAEDIAKGTGLSIEEIEKL